MIIIKNKKIENAISIAANGADAGIYEFEIKSRFQGRTYNVEVGMLRVGDYLQGNINLASLPDGDYEITCSNGYTGMLRIGNVAMPVESYDNQDTYYAYMEIGGSEGGNAVEWEQYVEDGVKIARIKIDGVGTDIFVPTNSRNAYSSMAKIGDFLYAACYTSLDYGKADAWFKSKKADINAGACSAIAANGMLGRNYDWLDSYQASVVVYSNAGMYKNTGLSTKSDITTNLIDSGEYSEAFELLPFYMIDGKNEMGLKAEINVVPSKSALPTVPVIDKRQSICSVALVRFILDNYATCDEAIADLRDHIEIYNPQALTDMGMECHFLISDAKKSYVIEFNNHQLIAVPANISTNFNIGGVEFNEDGSVYTPATAIEGNYPSSQGVEQYGQGLERYNMLNAATIESKADMEALLAALHYSNAYTLIDNPWCSEFVGSGITVDTPANSQEMQERLAVVRDMWASHTKGDGTCWITCSSAIYADEFLYVKVQEGSEEYAFKLPKAVTPQDIEDLQEQIAGKQDTLIAGSGITIEDNVISAEGGQGGECNYRIVDSLEEIENPVEGMKAFVKAQPHIGYTITPNDDVNEEQIGKLRHYNENNDEDWSADIYVNGNDEGQKQFEYHWEWENSGSWKEGNINGDIWTQRKNATNDFEIYFENNNGHFELEVYTDKAVEVEGEIVNELEGNIYVYTGTIWIAAELTLIEGQEVPVDFRNNVDIFKKYCKVYVNYVGRKLLAQDILNGESTYIYAFGFEGDNTTLYIFRYTNNDYRLGRSWEPRLMKEFDNPIQLAEAGFVGGDFYRCDFKCLDGMTDSDEANRRIVANMPNDRLFEIIPLWAGINGRVYFSIPGVWEDRIYEWDEIKEFNINIDDENYFIRAKREYIEEEDKNKFTIISDKLDFNVEEGSALQQQMNDGYFEFQSFGQVHIDKKIDRLKIKDNRDLLAWTREDIESIARNAVPEQNGASFSIDENGEIIETEWQNFYSVIRSFEGKPGDFYGINFFPIIVKTEIEGELQVIAQGTLTGGEDYNGGKKLYGEVTIDGVQYKGSWWANFDNEYENLSWERTVSSSNISNIVTLTQAQYDAMQSHNQNTFYIII